MKLWQESRDRHVCRGLPKCAVLKPEPEKSGARLSLELRLYKRATSESDDTPGQLTAEQ